MRGIIVGVLLVCGFWPSGFLRSREESKKTDREIEVRFQGNRGLAGEDLKRQLNALLADLKSTGIDESAREDAAYIISRYYQSRGFPDVVVKSSSKEREADEWRLELEIREGPRTFLESRVFEGNVAIGDGILASCFEWERENLVGELLGVGRKVYSPEVLSNALSCVESLYRFKGYWFVTVTDEVATESVVNGTIKSYRARVRIRIDEGPLVQLRKVEIEGIKSFKESDVYASLKLDPDVPFDPRLPLILKGRILDHYLTRGYPGVSVSIEREISREDASAVLRFQVVEGELAHISSIGLGKREFTRDWVIQQYIRLESGDLYNEDRVRESYRGLIRSGLFDSVSIRSELEDQQPGKVKLEVDVVEKARYTFTTLVGYGSWEQVRGGVVAENRSILGTGHRLRGEVRGSFKGERGEVSYLNPFFFTEELSQDASGFYERREQRTFTGQDFGGEMGLGMRITKEIRARLAYRAKESDLVELKPGLPEELNQDVFLGSVNLTGSFDSRDFFLSPTRGQMVRVGIEYSDDSLGSELDFLRATLDAAWVIPVHGRLRLALGGRTGVIGPLEDAVVIPIQERFFLGGDDTIRSYLEDNTGPKVNGQPVGGEAFLLFSGELRFPLDLLPVMKNLEGSVFGDAGTVNLDIEDYGGGRYFFAVGVGLRYETPMGPFRFDFAFNPDLGAGEDLFEFHFGLGYPF